MRTYIHYSLTKLPVCYRGNKVMGKSRTVRTTGDRSLVTCPKCQALAGIADEKRDAILDRRFGDLVAKRVMPDGSVFCICEPEDGRECGRGRTCTRNQLTSHSVQRCWTCAKARQRGANGRRNREMDWQPRAETPAAPKCICLKRTIEGRSFVVRNEACPVAGHGWLVREWRRGGSEIDSPAAGQML
jgi:hypothetical protein